MIFINYLVTHWLAELSNPFLIIRTMMRINGTKGSTLYKYNEICFAVVFLIIRNFVTPVWMIAVYEADNCIYTTKLCVSAVLYIQLFWCYKIWVMVLEKLKTINEENKKETPAFLLRLCDFFKSVNKNTTFAKVFHIGVFFLTLVLPQLYYGLVRGNLFNNI